MKNAVGIPQFPSEILLEIFSYLTPADLANCAQVNSKFRAIAREDSLWGRHLAKLGKALPSLSDLTLLNLQSQKLKYFYSLKNSFLQQQQELKTLSKNSKFSVFQISQIKRLLAQPISIKQVKENETILNNLNWSLVQDQCRKLNKYRFESIVIQRKGLTRIPNELMTVLLSIQPKNIFFPDNNLYYLPSRFSKLTDVTRLILSQNKFTSMPQVLFKLPALKELNLSHNRIAKLPMNLDKLSCRLDISANYLNALPADSLLIPDPEALLRTQISVQGICFRANHLIDLGGQLFVPFLGSHLKSLLFGFDLLTKKVPLGAIAIATSSLLIHHERKKWQASKKISKELQADESELYHAGRKAAHWLPYLKSFAKPALYSAKGDILFKAGLHDGQNNRPSRKRKLQDAIVSKVKRHKK